MYVTMTCLMLGCYLDDVFCIVVIGKLIISLMQPNLCVSLQIGESLTKFGVNEECKHLLIARMNATPEELNAISGMIRGESVPVEELTKLCDVDLITKLYKITKEELGVGGVEDAILCRIAARDTL